MRVSPPRYESVSSQTNMNNFHPLVVVCRGSDTQLQVGENLKK